MEPRTRWLSRPAPGRVAEAAPPPFPPRRQRVAAARHAVPGRAHHRLEADAEAILESISDGFVALGRDWRMLYVNRAAATLVGRVPRELLGRSVWDEFPGLVDSAFERAYRRVAATRVAESLTEFYPDHDRWYEARVYPAPHGISIYLGDASERKRIEQERDRIAAESDRQRRMYETALSNTVDFNYLFDLDGRFIYANEALLALWQKKSLAEAVGRNFFELGYPPELAERLQRQIRQVVETGRPARDETPYTGALGTRSYEYIFVPVFDAEGALVAVSGSSRDVTERRQVEQALREADRRKDEFLATLAHELRNPLAPLRSGLEVLRLAGDRREHAEPAQQMMERQLAQLVRLVDDLMDASRISRGKVALRRQPVELATVVRQAVESVQPLIDRGSQRLVLALPSEPIPLEADASRLAQVFANLLNNAAKFTPAGGRIDVSAALEGDSAVVRVADDGIGIGSGMQSRVFDLFVQADTSVERSRGGLGIGLSLARGLVELHGGGIEVRSDGPGRGSEFTVRLPVRPPPPAPAQPSPPADLAAAAPAGPPCRILVVDDNRDAARSMARVLRLTGHDTEVAHDGLEALALGAAFRPDVVVMDIGMPRLNGHDAARRMREQPWGRDATLVALTGWGSAQDRQRSREAGFDHHLVKPADLQEIQRIIAVALDRTAG